MQLVNFDIAKLTLYCIDELFLRVIFLVIHLHQKNKFQNFALLQSFGVFDLSFLCRLDRLCGQNKNLQGYRYFFVGGSVGRLDNLEKPCFWQQKRCKNQNARRFKVTFLGWLSGLFTGLSDLQLGDKESRFESPGEHN